MWAIPTFIISKRVLNTMSIIMKYSNGVDTTIRHTLYLKLFRSFGMYLSSGRAPIVKSMHDFCWESNTSVVSQSFHSHTQTNLILIDLAVLQFRLALFLKCNDNQGHENVNEEEWKYYEINDVEYGHLNTKVLNWTPVLICCGH